MLIAAVGTGTGVEVFGIDIAAADYLDPAIAANLAPHARQRALGRVAALAEVRVLIAWAVSEEKRAMGVE